MHLNNIVLLVICDDSAWAIAMSWHAIWHAPFNMFMFSCVMGQSLWTTSISSAEPPMTFTAMKSYHVHVNVSWVKASGLRWSVMRNPLGRRSNESCHVMHVSWDKASLLY